MRLSNILGCWCGRVVLFLAWVLPAACSGGGGGAPVTAVSLVAEPAEFRPAEGVVLRPRFPVGTARIDPDVGAVLSGGSYPVAAAQQTRTYTLTVATSNGTTQTSLTVPFAYRERVQEMTPQPAARTRHGSIALGDGRILLVCGSSPGPTAWATCELFDPVSGALAPAGEVSVARSEPVLARDGDGVLMLGGESNQSLFEPATRVERFDPASGMWTVVGHTLCSRIRHTATVLPSGWILLAGGAASGPVLDRDAEIWEPGIGARAPIGNAGWQRAAHTATRLADGRVMLAGGYDVSNGNGIVEVELFDPVTEQFAVLGALREAHAYHAAVPLPDGRVLLIGGDVPGVGLTGSAELFDPATGVSVPAGQLAEPRTEPRALRLIGGEVVVLAGLTAETVATARIELWNPDTSSFRAARADLPAPRVGCSANLLADGRVVLFGGSGGSGLPVPTALLFD